MQGKAHWFTRSLLSPAHLRGGAGCECPFKNQRCHFSGRNLNRAAPDPSDKMRYASPARTARIRTIKKPVCMPSILCLRNHCGLRYSPKAHGKAGRLGFACLYRRAPPGVTVTGAIRSSLPQRCGLCRSPPRHTEIRVRDHPSQKPPCCRELQGSFAAATPACPRRLFPG